MVCIQNNGHQRPLPHRVAPKPVSDSRCSQGLSCRCRGSLDVWPRCPSGRWPVPRPLRVSQSHLVSKHSRLDPPSQVGKLATASGGDSQPGAKQPQPRRGGPPQRERLPQPRVCAGSQGDAALQDGKVHRCQDRAAPQSQQVGPLSSSPRGRFTPKSAVQDDEAGIAARVQTRIFFALLSQRCIFIKIIFT